MRRQRETHRARQCRRAGGRRLRQRRTPQQSTDAIAPQRHVHCNCAEDIDSIRSHQTNCAYDRSRCRSGRACCEPQPCDQSPLDQRDSSYSATVHPRPCTCGDGRFCEGPAKQGHSRTDDPRRLSDHLDRFRWSKDDGNRDGRVGPTRRSVAFRRNSARATGHLA